MYILKNDNIINIDIKIDKEKLEQIIYNLKHNMNVSGEYSIVYNRFITLIEEIKNHGFAHDGKNLLEMLSDYKLYNRYKYDANIYYKKKLNQYDIVTNNQLEKILSELPNDTFAGLYGEIFQDELNNITSCFSIENSDKYFEIEVHKKIVESMKTSNKEVLMKWKNIYFSAVKNSNLINLLNIKNDINKTIIK